MGNSSDRGRGNETPQLSSAGLHILLSLASQDRHGYEIMGEVAKISNGKVKIGAGTLYRTLKRLLDEELIAEVDDRPDNQSDDERRRYYRLTNSGRRAASEEVQRMAQLVEEARRRSLGPSLQLA